MTFGNERIVELRLVFHADLFHHPARTNIADGGIRDDILQAEILEAETEPFAGPFGRISPAPVVVREPPSNLDTGREVGLEPGLPIPMNPMNSPLSRSSAAKKEKPWLA